MKLLHKHDTLWLEFGVFQGRTINYISSFTNDKVYGFDCFNCLPEKWRRLRKRFTATSQRKRYSYQRIIPRHCDNFFEFYE